MEWGFEITNRFNVTTQIEEPVGWDASILKLKRDPEMHGIFFEYQSGDFGFAGDVARMFIEEYEQYGMEGVMYLTVTFTCNDEYEEYNCKFYFGTYKRIVGSDCGITISVENNEDLMLFKNRMDQKVDLLTAVAFDETTPLSPYPGLPITITLPPKAIFVEDKAENANGSTAEFFTSITAVGSDMTGQSNSIAGFFVPPMDSTILSEIGSFMAPPNGPNVQHEHMMAPDPIPNNSMPNDWFPLPANVTNMSGPLDWFDKAPLDLITPIVNYDYTLQNFYGPMANLSLDVEQHMTVRSHTVTGIQHAALFQGATIYVCRRSVSNVLTWPYYAHFTFIPGTLIGAEGTFQTNGGFGPINIPLNNGDRIYVFVAAAYKANLNHTNNGEPTLDWEYFTDHNYFHLSGLSKPQATDCRVFMVNETLSRITEAITNDKLRVYSEYFGRTDATPYATGSNGCGSMACVTNGLFIRQMESFRPSQPTKLTLSYEDCWQGLNPIHNIGAGIEPDPYRPGFNLIRVESWHYFYDNDISFVCTDVDEITITAKPLGACSKFKFGYSKWEAEQYNGIDEFLTKREYRTELKNSSNAIERVSSFIASGYAIEVTRRLGLIFYGLIEDKATADWRFDNDTFIICLKKDGGDYVVELGGIDGAVNIIDPDSIYNFRITPDRNALRWLPVVQAGYRQADANSKLIFTNSDGNYYATGKMNSPFCNYEIDVIAENQTLTPGALDIVAMSDPMLPIWDLDEIKYKYPMSLKDFNHIKANMYKRIQFTCGALVGSGWIDNIDYSPNEGIAEFTLIPKREP